MPIFPYDDEEERRRRMLAPPGNPTSDLMGELDAARRPPALPEISRPNPPMLPPTPGGMGTPTINRQGRREQLGEARDVYLEGTPGRGKSALKGALQGFLGGGGLGGAITGGIYGAADPRGLREAEFERKIQPKIMQGFGLEDAERAQARQAEEDALNARYRTAQIGELESQAYKNRLPPPAPPDMFENASGLGIYNKRTGQVTTPAPPSAPKRDLRFTDRGMVDVNALPQEELGKLRPYQRPRQSGGGGGGGKSSSKDMRAANVDMRAFERLRAEAIRANQEADEEVFQEKRSQMEAMAERIDALYGDFVEVGEGGGWPYVKFRQGGKSAPQAQKTATPRGGSKKDPLGIR